ncbi:protein kinase [Candidatus Uabimicrobium sp. HlEnr_7]|uniref:WD40 repeat domain-containing serine/threonine protein kinase n=1 Tax=Candidatus Uabimicrobium helgolandensis TaxID=3095367 RepID=UPI003558F876
MRAVIFCTCGEELSLKADKCLGCGSPISPHARQQLEFLNQMLANNIPNNTEETTATVVDVKAIKATLSTKDQISEDATGAIVDNINTVTDNVKDVKTTLGTKNQINEDTTATIVDSTKYVETKNQTIAKEAIDNYQNSTETGADNLNEKIILSNENNESDDEIEKHQFGGYTLKRELGRGGMGIVYEAIDNKLERTVALKVLINKENTNETEIKRFIREARTVAKLDHPSIVKLYSVEETPRNFFTMEYVDGKSLKCALKQGKISFREISIWIEKVASGLYQAHEQGIIHRDIKPSNIMIDKNHMPKLMDFGVAKEVSSEDSLSKTGDILGTLMYMPPEQINNEDVTPASDVYSLGATLYEVITKVPPFTGDSFFNIINKVCHQDAIAPRQINLSIPVDLESICLKCLEKNPKDRYSSCLELAKDLRKFRLNLPISARRNTRWLRTQKFVMRNKLMCTIGTFIASLLIVTGSMFWVNSQVYDSLSTAEREKLSAQEKAKQEMLAKEQERLAKEKAYQSAIDADTMRGKAEKKAALAKSREAKAREKLLLEKEQKLGEKAEKEKLLAQLKEEYLRQIQKQNSDVPLEVLEDKSIQIAVGDNFDIDEDTSGKSSQTDELLLADRLFPINAPPSSIPTPPDTQPTPPGDNSPPEGEEANIIPDDGSLITPAVNTEVNPILTLNPNRKLEEQEIISFSSSRFNTTRPFVTQGSISPTTENNTSENTESNQETLSNNQIVINQQSLQENKNNRINNESLLQNNNIIKTDSPPNNTSNQKAAILNLAFSADGKMVASGHIDGTVTAHDIGYAQDIQFTIESEVVAVKISPNNKYIAATGRSGTVKIWDFDYFEGIHSVSLDNEHVKDSFIIDPPEFHEQYNTIMDFIVYSRKLESIIYGNENRVLVEKLDFNDGPIIVEGGGSSGDEVKNDPKEYRGINPSNIRSLIEKKEENYVVAMSMFISNRYTITVDMDDRIKLWKITKSRQPIFLTEIEHNTKNIVSCAVSRDGSVLITGLEDGSVRFWSIPRRQQISVFAGVHSKSVQAVAFSPKGNIAVSGGLDGVMRFWYFERKK